MKKFLLTLFAGLTAVPAFAAIKTKTIDYYDGKTLLQGYLAYDDTLPGKRPGILVGHEWWGLNDYARQRAEQLAQLGYVAFALDIYGKGIQTTSAEEAAKLSGIYKADRSLMRKRAKAGLDILREQLNVDPSRIAAIGYCFGGTTVLELARSGEPIKGVVSFHGGLATPTPDDAKNIKGKVLALHGGDDPYVGAAEVAGFEEEMKKGGVDWELDVYSKAVHAFTNPANGTDNSKGMAYNPEADQRSWERMKMFFAEIFQ